MKRIATIYFGNFEKDLIFDNYTKDSAGVITFYLDNTPIAFISGIYYIIFKQYQEETPKPLFEPYLCFFKNDCEVKRIYNYSDTLDSKSLDKLAEGIDYDKVKMIWYE